MKHIFLIIGIIGLIVSCHYEKPDYYKGESYITMWRNVIGADSGMQVFTPSRINNGSSSTITLSSSNTADTAWFKVQAFGIPSNEARKVMIEQYYVEVETEQGISEPVSGVNFVPLDDASLVDYMVVPADTAIAEIPVVVTYDPESAGKKFKLYFQLLPTEDFDVTPFAQCRGCVTFTNSAF